MTDFNNPPPTPGEHSPVASGCSLFLAALAGVAAVGTAVMLPYITGRFAIMFEEITQDTMLPVPTQFLVGIPTAGMWFAALLLLGVILGLETMAHKGVAIASHLIILLSLGLLWMVAAAVLFLPLIRVFQALEGA